MTTPEDFAFLDTETTGPDNGGAPTAPLPESEIARLLRYVPHGQMHPALLTLGGHFAAKLGPRLDEILGIIEPATRQWEQPVDLDEVRKTVAYAVEMERQKRADRAAAPSEYDHAGFQETIMEPGADGEEANSRPDGTPGHAETAETSGRRPGPVSLADALTAWRQEAADGRQPVRISTPCKKLNACLGGGFEPGDLVFLGARPGVGKSAWATEIARHAARAHTGVLIISREMAITRLVRRFLSQTSRIPATTIKIGRFTPEQNTALLAAMGALTPLPMWLDDQILSVAEITQTVKDWTLSPPLGLLIVDYLQLVQAPRQIRDRRLQVEAVSQGLKTLAMQCQLPVLCLSSLSRPEKGSSPDRRPGLADLRESGELEHDADIVLFLHRGFQEEETELIVAKNRDGRVGTTTLRFRPECVAFEFPQEGEE